LDLAVQQRSERPLVLTERAEERRHHLLAVFAVGHAAIEAEGGRVELHRFVVAKRDRRVREVGVRKDVVGRRAGAGGKRRGGEQFLFRIAERVRTPALDVVEIELEGPEPRLFRHPLVDRGLVDFQDLRLAVGDHLAELRAELLHLLLHPLVLADARVLVGHHAGVDVDPLEILGDAIAGFECLGQARRGRSQGALERGERRDFADELVLRRPPRVVGRVEISEVPLVFVGNFGPVAFLPLDGIRGSGGDQGGREQGGGEG
jgi:hypothetical protein